LDWRIGTYRVNKEPMRRFGDDTSVLELVGGARGWEESAYRSLVPTFGEPSGLLSSHRTGKVKLTASLSWISRLRGIVDFEMSRLRVSIRLRMSRLGSSRPVLAKSLYRSPCPGR
jgi:hypothetical protein